MSRKRVKAILFDIGNTLINASLIMNQALDKATNELRLHGYIRDKTKFKDVYERVDKTIQGSHINHLFSDFHILKSVWQELGLVPSYSAFGIFLVTFRRSVRESIKADRQIIDFCKSLKKKHIKLGIVSDGTVIEQLETLMYLGIIKYLDTVIVSEEFGVEKPDPILFQNALENLGVSADETLMVGDDLVRDIAGAKEVGMKTVLIAQYSWKVLPANAKSAVDIVVEKVTDIIDFIGD